MGKLYDSIDDKLADFIRRQQLFFIASAPLSSDGHVNLSPKGLDGLRILDEKTLVYHDLTGSGAETIAHVKENGRFVVMFCAFEGRPMILRLHGRGTVVERGDEGFEEYRALFAPSRATRSFIELHVERIADSCGWGVPLFTYEGQRDQYPRFVDQVDDARLREGQTQSNLKSIDGLPALARPSL